MLALGRIVPHFGAAREARVRLAGLFRAALRNKRDTMAALIGIGAVAAIVTNGLFMQSGPHPAPIFAVKPPPVIFRDATGAIAQLPRPRPAAAQRPEPLPRAEPVPLPRPRAQGAPPASRADPIAGAQQAQAEAEMRVVVDGQRQINVRRPASEPAETWLLDLAIEGVGELALDALHDVAN
jgi:hypothetical protein